MANILLKGVVRVFLRPPRAIVGVDDETAPVQSKRMQAWCSAVIRAIFGSSVANYISKIDFAWGDNGRHGDAEIDVWIPQEWDAKKIGAMTDELANAAYDVVGTTYAAEKAAIATLPKRNQLSIVSVKWVSLGVGDGASAGSVD